MATAGDILKIIGIPLLFESVVFGYGVLGVLTWILFSFLQGLLNLCTGKGGRARALAALTLSAALLVTPWLLLVAAQALGYIRARTDAWWPLGLMLGVPLWAMLRAFTRLIGELVRLRSHTSEGDRRGASGWGIGLAKSGLFLSVAIGSTYGFWIAACLTNLVIRHPEGLR